MKHLYLLLLSLLLAAPVATAVRATDGVAAGGILSDDDFFRLVTCGARPGGPCRGEAPRWGKRKITLAVADDDEPLPEGFEARLDKAINHALAQINGAGAGIRIVRTNARSADITVHATHLTEGTRLGEVPGFSTSGTMGVGYMTLWWGDNLKIDEASVLISTRISRQDMTSVVLEEITQSLGLLYDIDGRAYHGVSILSQTSNATTTIEGQDAMALRRLYPLRE